MNVFYFTFFPVFNVIVDSCYFSISLNYFHFNPKRNLDLKFFNKSLIDIKLTLSGSVEACDFFLLLSFVFNSTFFGSCDVTMLVGDVTSGFCVKIKNARSAKKTLFFCFIAKLYALTFLIFKYLITELCRHLIY